ncbi:MAG: FAD-binding oxidoreductase [Solirubrobacteraceae bacterium]
MTTRARVIAGIQGRLIQPGDAEYDTARRIFNGMIDRRPALIVRAAGPDDVVRALEYARREGLPLSIRGGGHNVAGNALADGGVVIDHSEQRVVSVDPTTRTADVQPGATWYDFDQTAGRYGLATTGGLVSDTGVAGFTLGGGIGWLVRQHGLACDNLIEADVVTADGKRLTASLDGDGDLLWALRGGGGNFGVVTRFRFRIHPVDNVTGGVIGHPRAQAAELLRFWRDLIADAPRWFTSLAVLGTSPDGHPIAAIALCHTDPDTAERDLAPLRSFGPPAVQQVGVMPYAAMQLALDKSRRDRGAPRSGSRAYWKADFLEALTDDAIEAIVEAGDRMPRGLSQVHIHHLGGAMAEEPVGGSAFTSRRAGFVFNLVAEWMDPAEDLQNIEWARTAFEGLRPYRSGGAYINFLGDDGEARVRAAYGSNYGRLAELKRRYDPDNVFRMNQNIKPLPQSAQPDR